jgi:hypothetical protein
MNRLLNHADKTVGNIYDRFSYADEDRAIIQKVFQHVMALVEPVRCGSISC